ncbi:hypothetical protein GALL_455900 [mine drainage metagenome]|uniref:Uncharacterized protein n=1 Tax=mine drainage metagenome TaxID=410659 RepID=A0A1J5PMP5_9ZZZZ
MPQQHGGNHGHSVGFEQVGGHAGAIAHVVAHIVGNHCRVARVVFGNAGFDLADQVGTDVGALGENSAAETGKYRDQGTAKGQTDQRGNVHQLAVRGRQ